MRSQRGGKALPPLTPLAWLESNRRCLSRKFFLRDALPPLPLPTQLPQLSRGIPRNGATSLASVGSFVCAAAFFSLPPISHHSLHSRTFTKHPRGQRVATRSSCWEMPRWRHGGR